MGSRPLGDDDRQRATQLAADARRHRAQLKTQLKHGTLQLEDLIASLADDRVAAKMPVVDVLEALPAFGPVKAQRLMQHVGIAANRRLGGLGTRQKTQLLAAIAPKR